MNSTTQPLEKTAKIRAVFNAYIERLAAAGEPLKALLSTNFNGYTVNSSRLITNRDEWLNEVERSYLIVPKQACIELDDVFIQHLTATVSIVTAFFNCQPPELTRLVLVMRLESESWKIIHSGASVPAHLIQQRNHELQTLVQERTETLKKKEAFYRLFTEDTMDVLWCTDANLVVTYISPSDQHFRGYQAVEVVGQHVFQLFNDEGIAIVKEAFQRRQEADRDGKPLGFVKFEAPHRCKDGSIIWGEVFSKADRSDQGKILGFHGITREITKRKELQDQINQLAFYDTLTLLPNRRLLSDRLNQAQVASKRTGQHSAIMFIDLDNFKPLNDQHGHFVGDLLLIEVAQRLKDSVREMDTVARIGGDEFVVLLGEMDTSYSKSTAYAQTIAEEIRLCLAEVYQLKAAHEGEAELSVEHHCTASIGVVVFQGDGSGADEILKQADQAMYQAKEAGRNTVVMVK